MNDNAISVSSPSHVPERGLLLFLATHVESWDSVLKLQQHVYAEMAGESPSESAYMSVAASLITGHLVAAANNAIAQQDTLAHIIIQHAHEEFRSLTTYNNTCADLLIKKLSQAEPFVQNIIDCYYREHYEANGLASVLSIDVNDVPGALCYARSMLDWYPDVQEWSINPHERLIPTLIEDYLQTRIDQDSLALLTSSLTRDLDLVSRFERQMRIHLLLTAMYVELEPQKPLTGRIAVERQRAKNARGSSAHGSSARTTARHTKSPVHIATLETHNEKKRSKTPLYFSISAVVLAVILSLFLMTANKGNGDPKLRMNAGKQPMQIATVSGMATVARAGGVIPALRGEPIMEGDVIETQAASMFIAETATGIRLELGEESKISSYRFNHQVCEIQLDHGSLVFSDRGGMTSAGLKITTPYGIISATNAQGVVNIIFGRTEVRIERGQATFAKNDGADAVTVAAGRRARSRPAASPVVLEKSVFLRAINMAGEDVTVEGKRWLGQRKAMSAGFSSSLQQQEINTNINLDKSEMNQVFKRGIYAKEGLVLSQIIPNGDIETTIWICSTTALSTIPIIVGNEKLMTKPLSLGNGVWRIGPLPAHISDHKFTLSMSATVAVAGVLFEALGSPTAPMPQPVLIRGNPRTMSAYVGKELTLEAEVDGDESVIDRIEYLIGGDVVGAQKIVPYLANWTPEKAGSLQIVLRTTDIKGLVHESTPIILNILQAYGQGSITREIWLNQKYKFLDYTINKQLLRKIPDSKSYINSLATTNYADHYVQRLSGYLHPPMSGDYIFLISGDDVCDLWLEDELGVKTKIAVVDRRTNGPRVNEFYKGEEQQSKPISLRKAQKYYFEVWLKEGSGEDRVEVAWKLPNGEFEIPLPGFHCSPNYECVMPSNPLASLPPLLPQPSEDMSVVAAINLGGPSVTINDVVWKGQTELEQKNPLSPSIMRLSSLPWMYAKNGYGPIILNASWAGHNGKSVNELAIGQETFQFGLGTHAPAELIYDLGQHYDRFQAKVGVNRKANDGGSVTFEVYADNNKLFDSGTMRISQPAKLIDVDVRGCKQLTLVVTEAGRKNYHDIADWGDAQLVRLSAPLEIRAGTVVSKNIIPKPSVDINVRNLLSKGIAADDKGIDIRVQVPNGNYYVYAWTKESGTTEPMPFDVFIEGEKSALSMGGLAVGGWQRQGPFPSQVNDGELCIQVPPAFRNAELMGLEILQDNKQALIATSTLVENNETYTVTLHNAKNNQPIAGYESLQEGAVIYLSQLPSRVINLSFNTPDEINNIHFILPKCTLKDQGDEFDRPFTLGKDGEQMHQWQAAVGDYHLRVECYADRKRKRLVRTIELNFKVVEE